MVNNAQKMGHGGGINGLRKPQSLIKLVYEVATSVAWEHFFNRVVKRGV